MSCGGGVVFCFWSPGWTESDLPVGEGSSSAVSLLKPGLWQISRGGENWSASGDGSGDSWTT